MRLKNKLTYTQDSNGQNLRPEEVAKFDELAHEWRNPKGKFASVLAFNQVRLQYITTEITHQYGSKKIRILDVGCGAGLLTQPLAEAGHEVLGIDASQVNISVANHHGKHLPNLHYRHALSDALVADTRNNLLTAFDLVINTEVLEHVPNPRLLLEECCALVAPLGILIIATLNRTWQSYLIGIIGAEYILRALPVGTHSWKSFVTPSEVEQAICPLGFKVNQIEGMRYNPLTQQWKFARSYDVNYLLSAVRKS
ncbi:bifunctional 2-polyprenyl-6-hydroxyphenol methylase/3-demethylubiquinol 3-O-methyltransferase UbiG [Vibrio sp. ZSDE26]|uniref:Ubiquinone biosynthesis O-methyltransferase n=1 Tax=Vibrio amylolyticus TaxID=2847292 RepID=A0A9X1XMC5_9VIBR|nr:bifunctional 2-polyprenyl-6-hydroxyphenol methylase/3-demethylubiquinol 3-O-methyltransferase UbiG [Vibrio amylolyticus]MCK6262134.1 bifunctional 2-polyprenyl-6-hydroxyphenol methylase/3-demethylubiquinol 3-O-methyltransferase UbiG [Vibrio amylolyticus]